MTVTILEQIKWEPLQWTDLRFFIFCFISNFLKVGLYCIRNFLNVEYCCCRAYNKWSFIKTIILNENQEYTAMNMNQNKYTSNGAIQCRSWIKTALMSDGRMVEVTPQTVTPPQYLTVGQESRERDGAKFRTQCGPTLASTNIQEEKFLKEHKKLLPNISIL